MRKVSKNKVVIVIMLLLAFVLIPNYASAVSKTVDKVTGLKISTQDTNSLTISWKGINKITGYKVYLYDTTTKKYEYYGNTKSKSMTIKNLKSAKDYKIKVRAYKTINGEKYHGAYSAVLETTTKPAQVKKVQDTERTEKTITLSWDNVSRANGYRAYIYNDTTKKYEYYGQVTTNSIKLENLKPVSEYKIKIRAYKTFNKTKYYGAYSSVLETITSPAKVKNVQEIEKTESTLTLSWDKVSKANGYRAYVYNDATNKYDYYGQVTTNSIKLENLNSASEYKIKIRAYKTFNNTKYYGSYSAILETVTNPAKVKNVEDIERTESTITLSWDKVSRANGYRVYVYNDTTKKYEYYGQVTTNSIKLENLNGASEYKIKIRAYKTLNDTKYYGSYSAVLQTATSSGKVLKLKSTKQTENSITISWDKVDNATGYKVYLYSQTYQAFKEYKNTTGTSITISNLEAAKFYKMYVKSYAEINGLRYYSPASATISQKTLSTEKIKAGIDVSRYQENIDWKLVKNSGVEFAMIRIGFRGWGDAGTLVEDEYFRKNIKNARAQGIEVGVYFFAYAKNEKEAKEESKWVLDTLKKYDITSSVCKYIAYDFESWGLHRVKDVSTSQINKNTKVFLKDVKNAGYTPILYANKYDLTNRFKTKEILSEIPECKVWLANYTDTTTYKETPYDMWQYSDTGMVYGILGNVDLNVICFREK